MNPYRKLTKKINSTKRPVKLKSVVEESKKNESEKSNSNILEFSKDKLTKVVDREDAS